MTKHAFTRFWLCLPYLLFCLLLAAPQASMALAATDDAPAAAAADKNGADNQQQDDEQEEEELQEPESMASKLRMEAEVAKQNAETTAADDAVWEEALQQNQMELKNMELEAQEIGEQLKDIISPLKLSLADTDASARRLFALATAHQMEPLMLEAIDQRGLLMAGSLRQQMQPLQTARDVVAEILSALEQVKKTLPAQGTLRRNSEEARTWNQIGTVERKIKTINTRLTQALEPADRLLASLDKMHTEINAYIPSLWQTHYLSMPSRFFEPEAWKDIQGRWEKSLQNFSLRMNTEFPRTQTAWQALGLRFVNVLLLGLLILFFTNRRLRLSEQRGNMKPEARRRILAGLFAQFTGLALLAASFSAQGEHFRGLLTLGSLFVIAGEMSLAWILRRLSIEKASKLTPLWPVYITSCSAVIICYPQFPIAVLSLSWIVLGLFFTLMLRRINLSAVPVVERNELHIHQIMLWISLGIATIGWPRMGILLLMMTNCILISTQLIIALMQLLNRSSEASDRGLAAEKSVFASITAAFVAPMLILLVLGGVVVWITAMPGGSTLLLHYLSAGVHVGSASFNFFNLFFILSAFYITRAAITAARAFLNRMSLSSRRLDTSLIPPMQTAITYGLWTLFALLALRALGFSLQNLAVIAGGLSVGIGFGMQNIVNNFFSGLILIFSRTLHEGDVIDVGDLQGTVRKISIRATMIETFDNAVIFVPNSEFVSNRLINWTRNGRLVRREVAVGVAYGTDPKLVEKLLLEVAQDVQTVVRRPQPCVLFMDFADSTLNFVLRYWADISNTTDAASIIRHKIVDVFAKNQVEIAFPQLDVHLFQTATPVPEQLPGQDPAQDGGQEEGQPSAESEQGNAGRPAPTPAAA